MTRLEERPAVVALARSLPGKLLMFGLFFALLRLLGNFEQLAGYAVCAAAISGFAGPRRLQLLPLFTLGQVLYYPALFSTGMLTPLATREGLQLPLLRLHDGMLALSYFYAWLLLWGMRAYPRSLLARRPFLCWTSLIVVLAVGATALDGLPRLVLWALVEQLTMLYWYVGYAILDHKSKKRSSLWVELGTFYPFWVIGSTLPIGKGAANLRHTSACDAETLAVTQVKGLKLLVFCLLLYGLRQGMLAVAQGTLHVPDFDDAFRAQLAGHPYPVAACWASVVVGFLKRLLRFAVLGNAMVALARLGGFRLLQFTYQPWAARTLVEFWNRLNYYFKELLVDFFFFPTFVRFLKGKGWQRVALATFMAATVGNLLAHFLLTVPTGVLAGWAAEARLLGSYTFYCLVLTGGLIVSQLGLIRRSLGPAILWVGLFYCLIYIFDETFPDVSLADHLRFLFHLFGAQG